MRTWMRTAAAIPAAVVVAGCQISGGNGSGNAAGGAREASAEAREDSTRKEQQALRDSGVTVDTQKIDTGTARPAPTEDN